MSDRLLAVPHVWLKAAIRRSPVPLRTRERMQVESSDNKELRIVQSSTTKPLMGLHLLYSPPDLA